MVGFTATEPLVGTLNPLSPSSVAQSSNDVPAERPQLKRTRAAGTHASPGGGHDSPSSFSMKPSKNSE